MSKNVPEIRFKGFTDEWKQRKLEDMCSLITKQTGFDYSATIKPALVTEKNDDTYSFIQNKDFEGLNINLDTDFYIPVEVAKRYPKITLDQPSLLITISGKIGNVGIYSLDSKAFIGGAVGICKLNNIEDGMIAMYELLSPSGHSYFNSLTKASSHANITVEDIRKISVLIPKDEEEKRIINGYFANLARLITLHQQEYDKLVAIKKSMLDKMIPKKGCNIPEIRFAGFNEPWKRRKIGDLLIERNEQYPKSLEYPLMAFVAYEGVAPKGERYDRSALVNDTENKIYKRTEKGDFIYSSNNLETGSIGLNNYGRACISPVYSIFSCSDMSVSEFIGQRLIRKDFISEMVKWRQGVVYGQWRIHEDDFLRIDITVPSVAEQKKIGAFLGFLDDLIALHQQELEKLKNIKNALLSKMFV